MQCIGGYNSLRGTDGSKSLLAFRQSPTTTYQTNLLYEPSAVGEKPQLGPP